MRCWLVALFALMSLARAACAAEFGEFVSPLIYRGVERQRIVELVAPFSYRDPKGKIWTVPPGIRVDGASIPRAFWSLIGSPFTGKYREASVIHDHYCVIKTESWEETHRVFYDGMRAKGVDIATANIMYAAVYRFGPRWLSATTSDGKTAVVAGTPIPEGERSIDIKALASRPGITPEEIRKSLDEALRVDARQAARILSKDRDCSVAVESVAGSKPPTILCKVDQGARGLLAKRNLGILATDIKTLLSANSQLLIPQIDQYLAAPTDEKWRAVKASSEEVLNVVTLTLISLHQYDSAVLQTEDARRGDSVAQSFMTSGLRRVLQVRSGMLEDQRLSPPRGADEVRAWKAVYMDLLRRLDVELAAIEQDLQ